MDRKYEVGAHVIYVDKHGKRRPALVTAWWDNYRKQQVGKADGQPDDCYQIVGYEGADMPGCNVVFVEDDERKTDQYGRQLAERETSIVHRSNQAAPGRYWMWPDEV